MDGRRFALSVGVLVLAAMGMLFAVPASAQEPAMGPFTLDEVNNSTLSHLLTGLPGYLLLCEGATVGPSCADPNYSDLVTFGVPPGQPSTVQLFSDNRTPDSPADIALPTISQLVNTGLPIASRQEQINENGGETVSYTPTISPFTNFPEPGFLINVPAPPTYEITSDPSLVPEPSTVALMVSGVAPFAVGYLRRRRKSLHYRSAQTS